ncbi:Garp, partial [Ophiophagus hannah]
MWGFCQQDPDPFISARDREKQPLSTHHVTSDGEPFCCGVLKACTCRHPQCNVPHPPVHVHTTPLHHPLTCTVHARAYQLIFSFFEAVFGLLVARGKPLQPWEAEKWARFGTSSSSRRPVFRPPKAAEASLEPPGGWEASACTVQVNLAGAHVPTQMALCATCGTCAIGIGHQAQCQLPSYAHLCFTDMWGNEEGGNAWENESKFCISSGCCLKVNQLEEGGSWKKEGATTCIAARQRDGREGEMVGKEKWMVGKEIGKGKEVNRKKGKQKGKLERKKKKRKQKEKGRTKRRKRRKRMKGKREGEERKKEREKKG